MVLMLKSVCTCCEYLTSNIFSVCCIHTLNISTLHIIAMCYYNNRCIVYINIHNVISLDKTRQ